MSESVLCIDFMTQRVSKFYTHNIENEKKKKNVGLKGQKKKSRNKGRVRQPTETVVGGWGAERHGRRWITRGLILLSRHLPDSAVAFFLRHLYSSLLMIIDWPLSPVSVVPRVGWI